MIVVNLGNAPQSFMLNDAEINGKPVNIFTLEKEKISNKRTMNLAAWGYKVYVY